MKKILQLAFFIFLLNGCAGTDFQTPPETKDELSKKVIIENDKFNKSIVVSTPLYLIRSGFTDTFPVMIQYKFIKKDNDEILKIVLRINDTKSGVFFEAVGEDSFKFSFEKINENEQIATMGTTNITKVGNFGYSNTATTNITRDSMELYFPFEQLEKMAKNDYKVKVYGKNKDGVFIIPVNISKTFFEAVEKQKN